MAYPLRAAYCASKWGLIGLTLTLAQEAGAGNVRVNAVCPGPVEGPAMDSVIVSRARSLRISAETMREQYLKPTALRRMVTASDVSSAVLFLCSSAARNITGQVIEVSAGFGLAPVSQSIFDEKADAHQEVASAIREASKTGKNIILDFGANWCGDCHALEAQMQKPELAALIAKSFVVVNVDVGRFDKNLDLAQKFRIPLKKGIPALAVLNPRGELLYAQDQGQFEDARHMKYDAIKAFFEQWKPK